MSPQEGSGQTIVLAPPVAVSESRSVQHSAPQSAHTLTPLRVLAATAPSGGEIRFVKFSEGDRELAFYHGLLTEAEDTTFWRAKLAAERPGVEMWEKAVGLLESSGWTVGTIE